MTSLSPLLLLALCALHPHSIHYALCPHRSCLPPFIMSASPWLLGSLAHVLSVFPPHTSRHVCLPPPLFQHITLVSLLPTGAAPSPSPPAQCARSFGWRRVWYLTRRLRKLSRGLGSRAQSLRGPHQPSPSDPAALKDRSDPSLEPLPTPPGPGPALWHLSTQPEAFNDPQTEERGLQEARTGLALSRGS